MARLVSIYNNGKTIVKYLRTKDGKVVEVVNDFYPYFYVANENGEFRSIFGEKLTKIVCNDPSEVPKLREGKRHFEADVVYVRRYLIDRGYEVDDTPLRKWYLDIEVEFGNDFPNPKTAEKKVTSWCVYDSYTKSYIAACLSLQNSKQKLLIDNHNCYVFRVQDEKRVLELFSLTFFRLQPDVLIVWNADFDIPYIINRCKKLNIFVDLRSCDVFDLMAGYDILFNPQSLALREVAYTEGFVSDRKTEYSSDIEKMFLKNIEDVGLCVKIDEKHSISDFFIGLKEYAGVESLQKTFSNSILIDTLLLKLAKKRGVLPSINENVEVREIQGAYVYTPSVGMFDGVAIFDISACYPSIILTFNISPETKTQPNSPNSVTLSNGIAFKRAPKGILPELCEMLLQERRKIEQKMSDLSPEDEKYKQLERKRDVVKYLINAVYGYTNKHKYGTPSRLYDWEVASSITHMAREVLMEIEKVVNESGYKLLYGDTDSIFVQIKFEDAQKFVDLLNEELYKRIKERYDVEPMIKVNFDSYYSKLLFKSAKSEARGAKKKYAGKCIWKKGKQTSSYKIVGFEAVRTDQSEFVKELQTEVIEMLLDGKSRQEIVRYVEEKLSSIDKLPVSKLAIYKGLQKPLNEYKNQPDFVRAVMYARKLLNKHFIGGRIKYIPTRRVREFNVDVIAFENDDDLKDVEIDYEKIRKQAREKIKELLDLIPASLERWLNDSC